METRMVTELIDRYKSDSESVYNTWFVSSEELMKAFRGIRRGVRDTEDSIAKGTFGTDFKGSLLEVGRDTGSEVFIWTSRKQPEWKAAFSERLKPPTARSTNPSMKSMG